MNTKYSDPDSTPVSQSKWGLILLAVASGVIAAMQVGKVPPTLSTISSDLELTRTMAGFVASLFFLIGALFGIAIGTLGDRLGEYKLLLIGLIFIIIGSLIGGLIPESGVLLFSRSIEGLGFMAIVVSAPKIVLNAVSPNDRSLAIGIWTTFMPVGIALIMAISPFLLNTIGWQGIWLFNAALTAVYFFALIFCLNPKDWILKNNTDRLEFDWPGAKILITRPGPWLFGICFTLYSLQWFAVMAWLPTFLIETQQKSLTSAALFGALVVIANVIGNTGAAWFMHRGIPRWSLIAFAYIVMGVIGALIFSDETNLNLKIPLAILFSALSGVLPTACLAGAPAHAPRPAQIAMATGFAMQGAALGSLLGPPLLGTVTSYFGNWGDCWWIMFICPTIGLGLVIKLRSAELQLTQTK
jgi:cyanate permease